MSFVIPSMHLLMSNTVWICWGGVFSELLDELHQHPGIFFGQSPGTTRGELVDILVRMTDEEEL